MTDLTKKMLFLVAFPSLLALLVACGRPNGQGGEAGSQRVLLQNKGSDTLVNVAQAWAEAYKEVQPNVAVAVSGGGSGTGISALINGTVDLANSSRKMKDNEIDMARQKEIEPLQHIVGYDALAVYLHHDHPAETLSLDQLAAIYGEGGDIENWSQLGYEVPGCPSGEIVRVSRQNNSGTYVYFKNVVLGKQRDYKLGSRDMHGSKDVADLVEKTPCAIGYSGLAYATPELKLACIEIPQEGTSDDTAEASSCVSPTVETANNGDYPIARPLFMYTAGEPTGAVKEYLDWILSDKGQCIIQAKGYAPVRAVTCI